MSTEAAETTKEKRTPLTTYLAQEPILRWAKDPKQLVTRTYRRPADDADMGDGKTFTFKSNIPDDTDHVMATRVDSPTISRAVFGPIDNVIVHWLENYTPQLMSWMQQTHDETTEYNFVQLRVTKVEEYLKKNYPDATPLERRRVIRNICCLISAAIFHARRDLAATNTLTIRADQVCRYLNWHTEMVLNPLSCPEMTPQQEKDAYDLLMPKREKKDDEAAAAPKKTTKKRAAEPEASPAEEAAPPAAKKKRVSKKKAAAPVTATADGDDFSAPPAAPVTAVKKVAKKAPAAKKPPPPKAPMSVAETEGEGYDESD